MNGLLRDGKVLLRPFEPEDAPRLREYLNDPGLAGCRYIPDDQPMVPLSHAAVAAVLEKWANAHNRMHLAVTAVNDGELLGHAEVYWAWDPLCPSVDLVIAPRHQRKGFGSAALTLLLNWVFTSLPAHNVTGYAADWNEAAQAFMVKHGFKPAGASRRDSIWRGRFVDEVVMDILRPEWEARHGS